MVKQQQITWTLLQGDELALGGEGRSQCYLHPEEQTAIHLTATDTYIRHECTVSAHATSLSTTL